MATVKNTKKTTENVKDNAHPVRVEQAEETGVAVAPVNGDITQFIDLNNSGFYASLKATTEEEKALLFNALSSPEQALADFINNTIHIKHIVAEPVELTNEETGEVHVCPRIIIIDKDDVSYSCVSQGIKNCLARLFTIYGTPEMWSEPLAVTIGQRKIRGNKNVLTLSLGKKKK